MKRSNRKPIVYLPDRVRVRAPGQFLPALRRGVVPEWHLVAARSVTGVPLPPLSLPLGLCVSEVIDVLVAPPSYCHRLTLAYASGVARWEVVPAVSPILIVDPDRHDPSRGWFGADVIPLSFEGRY